MGNKYHTPWYSVTTARGLMLVSGNNNTVDFESPFVLTHVLNCVNACAGMDDPLAEIAELKHKAMGAAVESLYTSSPETLQKAIEEAKADGFKIEFNSQMVYAHKAVDDARDSGIITNYDDDAKKVADSIINSYSVVDDIGSGLKASDGTPDRIISRKIGIDCAFDFSNVKTYVGLHDVPSRPGTVTPPSWHELGIFPPVGIDCEINEPNMIYHGRKIHVFAHYNGHAFAWDDLEQAAYHSDDPSEFRPIQTEKQKTIKAMLEFFNGFFSADGPIDNAGDVCEKIYDQFIADKKEK